MKIDQGVIMTMKVSVLKINTLYSIYIVCHTVCKTIFTQKCIYSLMYVYNVLQTEAVQLLSIFCYLCITCERCGLYMSCIHVRAFMRGAGIYIMWLRIVITYSVQSILNMQDCHKPTDIKFGNNFESVTDVTLFKYPQQL